MATLRSGRRKYIKKRLIQRDGYHCFYCGTDFDDSIKGRTATIDHKTPECKGGTHDEFNLALCCYLCNNNKGALTLEQFLLTDYYRAQRLTVIARHFAAA